MQVVDYYNLPRQRGWYYYKDIGVNFLFEFFKWNKMYQNYLDCTDTWASDKF